MDLVTLDTCPEGELIQVIQNDLEDIIAEIYQQEDAAKGKHLHFYCTKQKARYLWPTMSHKDHERIYECSTVSFHGQICRYCGKPGLHWEKYFGISAHAQWRLFNGENIHRCPKFKTDFPEHFDDRHWSEGS